MKKTFLLSLGFLSLTALFQSGCYVNVDVPSVCVTQTIDFPGIPGSPVAEVEGLFPDTYKIDESQTIPDFQKDANGQYTHATVDIAVEHITLTSLKGITNLNDLQSLYITISGAEPKNANFGPKQIINYTNDTYRSGKASDQKKSIDFDLLVEPTALLSYLRSGLLQYDILVLGTAPTSPWTLQLQVCLDIKAKGTVTP